MRRLLIVLLGITERMKKTMAKTWTGEDGTLFYTLDRVNPHTLETLDDVLWDVDRELKENYTAWDGDWQLVEAQKSLRRVRRLLSLYVEEQKKEDGNDE